MLLGIEGITRTSTLPPLLSTQRQSKSHCKLFSTPAVVLAVASVGAEVVGAFFGRQDGGVWRGGQKDKDKLDSW